MIISVSGKLKKRKMADEVEKKSEFNSLESLYFLLDCVVKCPKKQQCAIEEILCVLRTTEIDVICLKTTLEFYKSSYRTAVSHLERRLAAAGVLSEVDITKRSISSFLHDILFKVVTTSSTECATYSANLWLERVEAQHKKPLNEAIKLELPNPMGLLNKNDSAQPDSSILASFSTLTTDQRRTLLLECTSLLESISCQFYTRVITGLFVFLLLYKSQLNIDINCCLAEVEAWTDTWLHLLAASLLGKFKGSQRSSLIQVEPSNSTPAVHHILCGLMVATDSFKLLKSYPSTQRKVLKGLEKLIMFSSGFTFTWLNTMKFCFEL